MVTIDQAIDDLKNHIHFENDGEACTTKSEVIIILESIKLERARLESEKRKLAEFIVKNWHSCPIPVPINCKCGFQGNSCIECLLQHSNLLPLSKTDDDEEPSNTNPDADRTIFITSDMSAKDICTLIRLKSEKPWGTMYISVNNIKKYELLHFIKDEDVYVLHAYTQQSHYQCNAMDIAKIVYEDIHK